METKTLTFEYVYEEDNEVLVAAMLADEEGPNRLMRALKQYASFMAANRGSRRDATLSVLEDGYLTGDDLLNMAARGFEAAVDDFVSAAINDIKASYN